MNPLPRCYSRAAARRSDGDARRLTVGAEISLSGEIASCDTLIARGQRRGQPFRTAATSTSPRADCSKGTAEIDNADVRGTFEGNLVVRKRLLIRSGGLVSGTIRYGQIEVELGGQICGGDVQASGDADVIAELPNARAAS